MTIPAVCPHCDETFQVNPDLQGKTMRCPECREPFVVEAPPVAPVPVLEPIPVLQPDPFDRIETGDVVPPVPEVPSVPTLQPIAEVPTLQPIVDVPTARSLPVAVSIPAAPRMPGPKEVTWTNDDVPPAPFPARPAPPPVVQNSDPEEDEDRPFIRRRRRRAPWSKLLFYGLSLALIGTLAVIGAALYRNLVLSEQYLSEEAETAYKEGNYPLAQQKYEKLVADYPSSANHNLYRFFAGLAESQALIGSVTSRENPEPARKIYEKFLAEQGQTTFAQPETGYGADIVGAGRRLADTYADYSGDHLKKYRDELRSFQTNEAELALAENGVKTGRDQILPLVEKFRDKETSLEAQRKKYDDLASQFATERHRLAILAPFRTLSQNPTAEDIERFQIALKDNKLTTDPEAQKMLAEAETAFRSQLGSAVRDIRASVPVPPPPAVLFSGPVPGSPEPRLDPSLPADVILAMARGVLYALDAQSGELAWGLRVASPTADPRTLDLPVRVSVGAGTADLLLVPSVVGNQASLTARDVRSGDPVWSQTLEAPVAGRPLVVGGRIYLPLKGPTGTVAEFEVTTGTRTRDLSVRQPLAGGLGVLPGPRPGAYFLVIPGDAKRTFLFEIGREDEAGVQLPPRCVRVFLTDHPRDSLSGDPILITPGVEGDGPRYLVLAQTDGPQKTRLRAYTLPLPADLAPSSEGPPIEATPTPHEVAIPGWSWFPAQTDGERILLATDAGAFLAIGVNQIGNADRPLFLLPAPKTTDEQVSISRSQVVHVEEDSYWAVVNGQLIRLRTALDPAAGLRIIPQGLGRTVGEPVNRPQVRPTLGLGAVVVRPPGSPTIQVVAFDLASGDERWRRRVGLTPAGPPVVYAPGVGVVADEDGSVFGVVAARIPDAVATGTPAVRIAAPFEAGTTRAVTVASPDAQTLWVLGATADAMGRRLRIRKVTEGQWKADAVVPLPDQLGGNPITWGESLLIPLANGYVYKFSPGDTKLTPGPLWRGRESGPTSVGLLAEISDQEFLAGDGGRKLFRWKWTGQVEPKAESVGGPWEAKAKIELPPAVIRIGGDVRFAAVEETGLVLLFDPTSPGDPVRRWVPGRTPNFPRGKPTDQLMILRGDNRDRVTLTLDRRHALVIDPTTETLAWTTDGLLPPTEGELIGLNLTGSRLLLTAQSGLTATVESETGTRGPATPTGLVGVVAASGLVPLTTEFGFLILSDGTAGFVTLPVDGK